MSADSFPARAGPGSPAAARRERLIGEAARLREDGVRQTLPTAVMLMLRGRRDELTVRERDVEACFYNTAIAIWAHFETEGGSVDQAV